MATRRIISFSLLLVLLIGLGLVLYITAQKLLFEPRDPSVTATLIFDTETHPGLSGIAQGLEKEGFIRSGFSFRMLARFQKKDTLIKAGEYELSPAMTPQEILNKMVRGEMRERRATIKEGMTIKEIGGVLQSAGILDAQSFYSAAYDRELLASEGISAASFEGYLFPDTYNFRRNAPARRVISAMHEEFKKHWNADWVQRASILGMPIHEIVTLASIIEKESGNFDEQPVISSVLHNRLRKKMRLQADPTVIYGIKDFNGNITKQDLLTATPYNTYVIDGLPPGPISNPGFTALKAALYPADTNFLYFVGNGAGRHIFSETLGQHNDAVNVYQRGRGADREKASNETPAHESEQSAPSPESLIYNGQTTTP